jgi:hypothetical protein
MEITTNNSMSVKADALRQPASRILHGCMVIMTTTSLSKNQLTIALRLPQLIMDDGSRA